jgi:hypothetical protein
MKRALVIVCGGLVALATVGLAVAGLNSNYSVHATGDLELPIARDTPAQGQAIFHVSEDGTSIDYRLISANIENPFMAHIHLVQAAGTGPPVVWLYPTTAPVPGPTGIGRAVVNVSGTITAANLVGPLAGQPLSELIEAMNSGNAYVNVHTSDGDATPNEGPGDFPGGEIRANLPG